jgi:hypothetical protein
MERKRVTEIVRTLLLTIMVSVLLIRLPVVKASPSTVLSVSPISIVNPALEIGSIFRIDITVADVQHLWGVQFRLSYNTGVLTATSYGLHLPFQSFAPSEINDEAGYVALAFYTYMGDYEGLTTTDPKPIAWIEFIVDNVGTSMLDLHDSIFSDIYGNPIAHNEGDGFFDNQPLPPQPVPEFPVSSAMPIAVIPLLFYIWWKRKQKTSS